jgi:hypothetical protein
LPKQTPRAGLAAGSVNEAAKPNIHNQTYRQENKQRSGPPVAHERKRDAGHGHSAYDHSYVYQNMKPKRCCDAHYKKHSGAVFRALSILY